MPIVGQFGSLAGLGSLILPGGAMESIATVTVGSGGASNVEFTNIPGGFQHLQIRSMHMNTNGSNGTYYGVRVNGDTATNYARHYLAGAGTNALAGAASSQNYGSLVPYSSSNNNSYPCVSIVDVLDYASTSKTKVLRIFAGNDSNGFGSVDIQSTLWNSTSAITSIRFNAFSQGSGTNFGQHTIFALYGLRAP